VDVVQATKTEETAMMSERVRTLGNGIEIPYLGFGTFLIPDAEAGGAVDQAIGLGYRNIDTAEAYKNEAGVGAGIKRAIQREGLRRSDLFVTTKLWPGNAAWGETPKTTATTLTSFDESLSKLGLDYVDLYLIHAPFDPEQRLAQWRGLVTLHEQKRARAIGVSNFSIQHLEELKAANLPLPHANQIEIHPWSQKPELVAYLKQHEITPIAYSSLVPLATWRAAPGHASAKTDAMKADGQRTDSPFKALAAKHGATEAQVLLRWAIQNGYPVLPKSTKSERMKENASIFSFALSDEEMAAIAEMDRGDGVAWSIGDPTKLR
jgi:2,5-diketo-D-gluconate reductase A